MLESAVSHKSSQHVGLCYTLWLSLFLRPSVSSRWLGAFSAAFAGLVLCARTIRSLFNRLRPGVANSASMRCYGGVEQA